MNMPACASHDCKYIHILQLKTWPMLTYSSLDPPLFEKPSVTQDQNMWGTENSVIHIDWASRSMLLTDFSDRSTWMMEFSVTHMFWSCVTLSLFNSAWMIVGREGGHILVLELHFHLISMKVACMVTVQKLLSCCFTVIDYHNGFRSRGKTTSLDLKHADLVKSPFCTLFAKKSEPGF
jgi:hypothetical protein